jgi:uncharacterized protein Yka (UPF0111/DUF47 family)
MSGKSNSIVSRVVNRVFPVMPDFYGLVNEQCDLAVEALNVFVEFMETGDEAKAVRVRELEKAGDELKARNIDVLNEAFSTPMDREDLYRAITSVDHVINYAKTTTREMEVLQVTPDQYTLELAILLRDGTVALQRGFAKLSTAPATAEEDAQAARKAERNAEKAYRRALAELFAGDDYVQMLNGHEEGAEAKAMQFVIEMFKRREIYRHLSNAADRLARAGDTLHDIVVKIA